MATQRTLGGEESGRELWLDDYYVSFSGGGTSTLEAEYWLDTKDWRSLNLLLTFAGSNGGSLTAYLQTAVSPSADDTEWAGVGNAGAELSGVMSAPVTWMAKPSTDVALAGVVRLKFVASGAVTGVLRVIVVGKGVG